MKHLEGASVMCSGRSVNSIPRDELLKLDSIGLNEAQIFVFTQALTNKLKVEPISVEVSKRKTKNRRGTAWNKSRRIVLYRHSAETLIHELAHIVAPPREHHSHLWEAVMEAIWMYWKTNEVQDMMKVLGNMEG